jgi:hypothetical protein
MAGNSAELPEIEFGIQACEVVRDAMLIASRAGRALQGRECLHITVAAQVFAAQLLPGLQPVCRFVQSSDRPVHVWAVQASQRHIQSTC